MGYSHLKENPALKEQKKSTSLVTVSINIVLASLLILPPGRESDTDKGSLLNDQADCGAGFGLG